MWPVHLTRSSRKGESGLERKVIKVAKQGRKDEKPPITLHQYRKQSEQEVGPAYKTSKSSPGEPLPVASFHPLNVHRIFTQRYELIVFSCCWPLKQGNYILRLKSGCRAFSPSPIFLYTFHVFCLATESHYVTHAGLELIILCLSLWNISFSHILLLS